MNAFNLDGDTPLLVVLSTYLLRYYAKLDFVYNLITYGADVRLKNLYSSVTVLHLVAQIEIEKDGLKLMRTFLDRYTYIRTYMHTHIQCICIHPYITYLHTYINMYVCIGIYMHM